jgi:hypothetical protein
MVLKADVPKKSLQFIEIQGEIPIPPHSSGNPYSTTFIRTNRDLIDLTFYS